MQPTTHLATQGSSSHRVLFIVLNVLVLNVPMSPCDFEQCHRRPVQIHYNALYSAISGLVIAILSSCCLWFECWSFKLRHWNGNGLRYDACPSSSTSSIQSTGRPLGSHAGAMYGIGSMMDGHESE